MAMRSACELQYHLLLAKDLDYLDAKAQAPLNDSVQEVKRMLSSLIGKVRLTKSH
jgi:four helix bundle protein